MLKQSKTNWIGDAQLCRHLQKVSDGQCGTVCFNDDQLDAFIDVGYNGNGMFYMNSGTRFGDIPDGTTNTFMVAEVQDELRGTPNSNRLPGSDRRYCFSGNSDNNPPTDISEYLI